MKIFAYLYTRRCLIKYEKIKIVSVKKTYFKYFV